MEKQTSGPPSLRKRGQGAGPSQPRPMNGIVVAITVMNCTFASSGSVAMKTTARATWATSIVGSGSSPPCAWGTPALIVPVMLVAALPMSICPQAMSCSRPSRDVDLVRPVIACFVAVYGAERGRPSTAR